MNDVQHIFRRAQSWMNHYIILEPHIQRINDLVQNNPKFFGGRVGELNLELAANKLEELIQESKAND